MAQEQKKTAPDWERIEADFRAGLLSVREIAFANGVSHTAIQKRAKAQGWDRDLGGKIKSKADALVAKREVASQVATATAASERQLIEAGAEAIARVRLAHRADISRSRALAMSLLAELEGTCIVDSRETLESLKQMLRKPGEEISPGMARAISEQIDRLNGLPGRAKVLKDLCDSLRVLIALEREAYGLASLETPPPTPPQNPGGQVSMPLEEYERRARRIVEDV